MVQERLNAPQQDLPPPQLRCSASCVTRKLQGQRMSEELEYAVLHEFVAPARRNLSRATWDYLMGAAETETTFLRNRSAIDAIVLRPRVLRNVEKVDTSARLLGRKLELPIILAPIGSLQD